MAANPDTFTGGCTAGSGADALELTSSVISVSAQATLSSDVTINGAGNTIQSNGSDFMILNVSVGDVTINNTIVQDGYNASNFGAGVRVYSGSLNINQSTFTNNSGGAVLFSPGTSGSIIQSVISGNDGVGGNYYSGGGGLYIGNYGGALDLTVSNSTISGNSSNLRGGGISHQDYGYGSTVVLSNVTLVDNTSSAAGGGLSNDNANITLNQTLISGNSGSSGAEVNSTGGTVTADDYNLFGLNSSSGVVGVTVGASDIVPSVATLAEILDVNLADNGGFTPTHTLAVNSPAMDVVPPELCASETDQTGKLRPADGDLDGIVNCDVGAVEVGVSDVIFKDGFEE